MRRVLQVVAERSQRQFGNRHAVEICGRAQGRLSRWSAVKFPGDFFRDRQRVKHGQFRKQIVPVLMIDELLAMVRLARLKKLRESGVRQVSDSAENICRKRIVPAPHLRCSISMPMLTDSALPAPRGPPCWL